MHFTATTNTAKSQCPVFVVHISKVSKDQIDRVAVEEASL